MSHGAHRRGKKGAIIGINSTTLLFPYNAASSSTNWSYGIIHAVVIGTQPVAEQSILIRDAADTVTLAGISLPSGPAHPAVYHVHIPIEQPWGVKLSAADGMASITFEQIL